MSTPVSIPAPSAGPPQRAADAHRHHNEGHGRRLTSAFEALEEFPALAESRNRLLRLVSEERPSTGDVVNAVESDVALVIAVLRLANQVEGKTRGRVESIVQAVELPLARIRPDARVACGHLRLLRALIGVGRRP